MSGMPRVRAKNPSCGACGRETRFESDQFICEECLLSYGGGEDETPAEFLDEEAAGCNKQCDNYWHGHGKIKKGAGYECHPCRLPAEHTSMCWSNCTPIDFQEAS